MDTQNLEAFVEAAQSCSFSIAAETLHLTQPAISKRIASLEMQLDCKLFDRISRTISLTEAGNTLLPKAKRILQDVRDAAESIRDLQGSVRGQLSMGISHHIGLHRLPPILRAYRKQYPDVRLDIDFMDSEEAYDKILHGNLDVAVVTLAEDEMPPLERRVLWQDELCVVSSSEHPLSNMKKIPLSMLCQHTAILPSFETYTGQIIKDFFDQQQLTLDISMSTHYLETIKAMVSIGLGWSILPKTMIDESLVALDVVKINLQRPLGYVFHRDKTLSNAASAFVDALEKGRKG
jgi:DNA-binding transcriptional LysR family regulator